MASVNAGVVTLSAAVPQVGRFSPPSTLTWVEVDFAQAARISAPTRMRVLFNGTSCGFVSFGQSPGLAVDQTPGTGDEYVTVEPGQFFDVAIDPETDTSVYVAVQAGTSEVQVILDGVERTRSRP